MIHTDQKLFVLQLFFFACSSAAGYFLVVRILASYVKIIRLCSELAGFIVGLH